MDRIEENKYTGILVYISPKYTSILVYRFYYLIGNPLQDVITSIQSCCYIDFSNIRFFKHK